MVCHRCSRAAEIGRRGMKSSASWRADHYATLEVSPGATKQEIKKSFYALSRKFHPDAPSTGSMTVEARTARFQALSESYAVLSDDGERRKYDQTRRSSAGARSGYVYSPSNEAGTAGRYGGASWAANEERRRTANYAWQHPSRRSGPQSSARRADPFAQRTTTTTDPFNHFEAFAARERRRASASAASRQTGPGSPDDEAEQRLVNDSSVLRTGQVRSLSLCRELVSQANKPE